MELRYFIELTEQEQELIAKHMKQNPNVRFKEKRRTFKSKRNFYRMRKEAVWVTRRLSFCPELPHRGGSAGCRSPAGLPEGGEPLAVRV